MLAKLGEEQKEAIQVMKKRTESDRQDLFAANSRIEHLEKLLANQQKCTF
jgi:hypothetical protein